MKKRKLQQAAAHKLVAQTAREMAGAIYEELAKNNEWYKANPSQTEFIERVHGSLLVQARDVLASMLALPNYPETLKEQIAEALILDNQLQLGRRAKTRVLN